MNNKHFLLTLKYTLFMSVVLITSLIIIFFVSEHSRHNAFRNTLRSEAITKANLFLENRVDAETMQHIYLNNTQFINEVEVAVYTPDFQMLYHDAAQHDIVKESKEIIDKIKLNGEMDIEVEGGYQAIGILYKGEYVVTAAAFDGYGKDNMRALRNTLITIFVISILFMFAIGYLLATFTIRPIERALSSQKMFVSNVSHELRTPLAAIMGELGLALQKERSPADYQVRLERALADSHRMSDTIIGLLNMARAEYDASQIKMESIRVDELLMDVRDELLRAKPEYHINISFADAPNNDEQLCTYANRYLLSLAIRNLIENNSKYSQNKTSNIKIHFDGGLAVDFADTGMGMNATEQKNLFRMFYRGTSHKESGHGIGMALVQRILVLHKASIDVLSKEGHGTTFTVKF